MSAQDLTPAERNRFARTLDRLQSGARLRIHLGDDFELQTEIDLIPSWDHAIRTALIADMQRTLGLDPDPPPAAPALALPVPENAAAAAKA